MKGDKISRIILILEIVVIVLLHINKKNSATPNPNPQVPGASVTPSNANVMATPHLK